MVTVYQYCFLLFTCLDMNIHDHTLYPWHKIFSLHLIFSVFPYGLWPCTLSVNTSRPRQMAASVQRAFSFSRMKTVAFQIKCHRFIFPMVQLALICSDNDLSPSRRQAIIWTNDGQGYWCLYAWHCLDELCCKKCGWGIYFSTYAYAIYGVSGYGAILFA